MSEVPSLMSVNEAADFTSLSRTAISKLRSEGKFPKVVRLGEKRVAFVRSEVVAWVEQRIAARAAEARGAHSKASVAQ